MQDDWAVSQITCTECGYEWVAVHPICEWLQCECGAWTQVPPCES